MLLRIIGWLLLIEAIFMCIPALTAFIYKEASFGAFLIGAGICLGAGLALMSLRPASKEMRRREAMMLTAMVWVVFSIFGMVPYLVEGSHFSVTDAFFDAVSSFTTTGMSAVPSIDALPRSFIMWRGVMQWIGGMGIILFTLAVLPMLNYQGGMQMFNAEVTGITHDKLRPRVSSTAKSLWLLYFSLTVMLMFLLWLAGMTEFDAICYGLYTMSTGGFATTDAGIHGYNSVLIKCIFCVFMLLGSINFSVLYQVCRGQFRIVKRNTALKWFLSIILISTLIMAASVWHRGLYHDISDITIDPLFQTISVISSTGLLEPDFASWGSPVLCVIVALIFIGGCAGSTSGGAKVDRIVVCFKNIRNEFYRIMHPNAVLTVRINGHGTSEVIVQKAIVFLILYVMIILAGGVVLLFAGIPMDRAFLAVLECISNTGLSVDLDGTPTDISALPDVAKWTLMFVMLVGRLELYTVLLIFTPIFWRR